MEGMSKYSDSIYFANLANILEKYYSYMGTIMDIERFKRNHEEQLQSLTTRELEIFVLLVKGNNNPEIAEILFISRYTVEEHRRNINRKLNVKTPVDLYKYGFYFGMI